MSIARLESARQFTARMVLLNRFHAPDQEDYETSHHALGEVHHGFPDESVARQCAYIVAKVVELRPFEEANFRTAWDYVADLLRHRDFDLRSTLAESQELGNQVWSMQDAGDDVAGYLEAWFQPRIHQAKGAHAATLI